jgi:glycosyltransferase involved in cell wall biosynthesis
MVNLKSYKMTKVSAISVFFPAFNEQYNIKNTLQKAIEILPKYAQNFEIIVVNDGSSDQTREIVEEISKKQPKVKIINHKNNLGYGSALKTGFYSAKSPLIVFTDSDGQFDISELPKFLEKIQICDLAIGYRRKRSESGIRLVNAKAWGFLIRFLFGLKVKDLDCGFKLIKKKVIDTIPKLESNGALISAELLIKAKKTGFKIAQIPVNHYPRQAGNPSGANFFVIVTAFIELFKLYRKLK